MFPTAFTGHVLPRNYRQFADGAAAPAAPLSPTGQGNIRYNDTTKTFQVSIDAAAYVDIATGAAQAGALEFIEQKIIAADTAAVTFSGLNGEADEIYVLVGQFINNAVGAADYSLEPNGITAAQTTQEIEWSGVFSSTLATLILGVADFAGQMAFDAVFHARRSVGVVTRNRFFRSVSYGDTSDIGRVDAGVWANTGTTVTSLDVTSNLADGIGIGSTLSLYKLRQS